ncbi:AAA family ATPase [Nonomuraea muscovyensis]|uniref:MinD/ParA family ATP-binding protein n=1 Tax=Nonomuraea muscovyensis TaxID=1124761 RepID=UPI0033CCB359
MARQDREESLEEQLAWLDAIKETDEAPLKVSSPAAAATADEPVSSPYPEDPWGSVAALQGDTPTPPLFRAAVDSVYGPHAAEELPAGESEATEWLETVTPKEDPGVTGQGDPSGRADDPFLAPLKPLPRPDETDPYVLSSPGAETFSGAETLSGDETLPRLDRPGDNTAWPEPPGWPASPSALDEPRPAAAESRSGAAEEHPVDEPRRTAFEAAPATGDEVGRPADEAVRSPFELRLGDVSARGVVEERPVEERAAGEPRRGAFEVPPVGDTPWGATEPSWQRSQQPPASDPLTTDTRPATDSWSTDTRSATDSWSTDTRPAAEPWSNDTRPAAEPWSTDSGPADTRPAETRPADPGPADPGPAETRPADLGPAGTRPAARPEPQVERPRERPEGPAPERARRPAPVSVFGTSPRPPATGRPTADSLDPETLLRGRRNAPSKGWRRLVYKASGGWIKPGEPPEVRRRRELVGRARTPVATGHHRVAVLSLKGGVGKTTTTVGLGATLAQMRGDRVIAIDANPDRGTLSDKLHLETSATVRDLLNERDQVKRYVDIRAFTSQAPSRLEVLASDRDPSVSEAFSGADYQAVSQVLENFYSICITDCGTGLLHSAMGGVLGLADQLVLVSSPSVDGARAASATLDWLEAHHYGHLVKDATVVLCSVRPRSKSAVDIGKLEAHFAARCRAVVRVPYDPHLEEGAEIDLDRLQEATRDAYLQLAASVGDGFAGTPDGYAGDTAGGLAGGRGRE